MVRIVSLCVFVVLVAATVATFPATAGPAVETGLVTWVQSGDVIYVLVDGREMEVRYIGVDAPRYGLPAAYGRDVCYGREAYQANVDLVLNRTVTLTPDAEGSDHAGRAYRYVDLADGTDVSAALLRGGYGWNGVHQPNTARLATYVEVGDTAQRQAVGWWGACEHSFQTD